MFPASIRWYVMLELSSNSSADRPASAVKNARQRSRVTNGRRTFVEGDGRSPWARRWRDLIEAHVADMGGINNLSAAQRSPVSGSSTGPRGLRNRRLAPASNFRNVGNRSPRPQHGHHRRR